MPNLDPVMTYRLRVKGPLGSTDGSPVGAREYWEMSEGWLSGPHISARIAMPGGDWMLLGADGFWRPDVRVQLQTEDGAVILLRYTGLVERTEKFTRAAEEGAETRFEDQYMRMALTFETGDARYAWLTQALFIAEGRLAGPNEIEYRIYRVT